MQVTPEVREHVEAGLAAKKKGDWETAVREFQRVAELMPSLAAAHVNLGAVYYDKKDFTHAIPELRKAIELNPDLPGARAMLGAALLAQGYAAEAIPYLDTDDLLGIAFLESGRERDAIDKFEASLSKRPDDPDLLYYLSQAHSALSRELFEKLVAEHPDSARAQQLLGEANAAAGRRVEAENHLHAALAKRHDLRGVHLTLGELYLAGGDYANAQKEFAEEARLTPGSAAAAYKLGSVLLLSGDDQAAFQELSRADKLQPGMPQTEFELGKAAAALGEIAKAVTLFQKTVAQSPELTPDAHFQLARLYRKMGNPQKARSEMNEFEKTRKTKPQ